MIAIYVIGGTIFVCTALICLTVWAVMTKKYDDGCSLEEIQHLSDLSAGLVDTAVIYKQIGMDKEAEEAMQEAIRLDTMVWDVINGVK